MALPDRISLGAELAAFAAEATEDVPIPPDSSGYEIWRSAIDRHAAQLDRLQARTARVKEITAPLVRTLRDEGAPLTLLDEIISGYEQEESDLRKVSLPQIKEAEGAKRRQFALPVSPADRARAIAVWDRAIRVHSEMLATIRDLRFQLMAFRAELEDPGDAPVFDNPDSLFDYLAKNQ
jgi:hypothetical protein